jgi:hypothetical protein
MKQKQASSFLVKIDLEWTNSPRSARLAVKSKIFCQRANASRMDCITLTD